MSPKLTFTIGSAITFFFSAAFFIAPEFFTMTAFPAAKGFAIDVGITMRYVLAATIFGVCCLLFQARKLEREADQKNVLLGAAAIVLCHRVARELGAGVLGGLTAATFWSAYLPVSVFAGLAVRKLGYFWLPPLHHGSGAPSRLRGCRSAATPT